MHIVIAAAHTLLKCIFWAAYKCDGQSSGKACFQYCCQYSPEVYIVDSDNFQWPEELPRQPSCHLCQQ